MTWFISKPTSAEDSDTPQCSRAPREGQVDRGWDLVGQLVTGERACEADGGPLVAERGLDEVRIGIKSGHAEEASTDPLDRPLLVQVPELPVRQPVPSGVGVAEQLREPCWKGGCTHGGNRTQLCII